MLKKSLVSTIVFLTFARSAFANDGDRDDGRKWVASWATSPATFFHYTPPVPPVPPGPPTTFAPANIQPDLAFPFPDANTLGATDQTIRSIVKPDLWGNKVRIRLTNVFGNQAVTFDSVTVGLQEYSANVVKGTIAQVTTIKARTESPLRRAPSRTHRGRARRWRGSCSARPASSRGGRRSRRAPCATSAKD